MWLGKIFFKTTWYWISPSPTQEHIQLTWDCTSMNCLLRKLIGLMERFLLSELGTQLWDCVNYLELHLPPFKISILSPWDRSLPQMKKYLRKTDWWDTKFQHFHGMLQCFSPVLPHTYSSWVQGKQTTQGRYCTQLDPSFSLWVSHGTVCSSSGKKTRDTKHSKNLVKAQRFLELILLPWVGDLW